MDMLIFTPRAESNALITWNMHHWWKKKTYAVNKIYIVFQFLEPQVKRMVRSRALYRWNRGSWKSAPASLCDFWCVEGNVLMDFSSLSLGPKKKKRDSEWNPSRLYWAVWWTVLLNQQRWLPGGVPPLIKKLITFFKRLTLKF